MMRSSLPPAALLALYASMQDAYAVPVEHLGTLHPDDGPLLAALLAAAVGVLLVRIAHHRRTIDHVK